MSHNASYCLIEMATKAGLTVVNETKFQELTFNSKVYVPSSYQNDQN